MTPAVLLSACFVLSAEGREHDACGALPFDRCLSRKKMTVL